VRWRKKSKFDRRRRFNFCQCALEKFHFGTPWSSGVVFALTFVKTIEWSLPKNSLVTVHVQREAYELETWTESNWLHALRTVSEKCIGVVGQIVYVESIYQRSATTVCVLAAPHPVVSVKITRE